MSTALAGSSEPVVTPPPAGGTPPPAAVTPPAGGTPPPAMGAGATVTSWRDSLPAELKDNQTLAKYSDVGNLAQAYLHAQQALGKKGVIRPSDNATPEEWKSFKEAIGVPALEKYEIVSPKGFEVPPETMKWMKETSAKIGILPQDASALLQDYLTFEADRTKSQATAKANAEKAALEGLSKEWGDKYQTEMRRGLFAVQKLGDLAGIGKDKALALLNRTITPGNDPDFIKLVSAASKLFSEDSLRESGIGQGMAGEEQIENQIKEVQGQLMSMPKNDPRRPALAQKHESLWKQKTRGA
jgi:hypothetical protein